MPAPARQTTFPLLNFGAHATPKRGPKPHWRPLSVESLTPGSAELFVIAGDDEACAGDGAVGRRVKLGIEVEEIAVLLAERPVEIVTQSRRDAEVGQDLPFIHAISADVVGAVIAVGIALKDGAYVRGFR